MSSEASWPDGNLETPFPAPVQIPNEGKVKLALTIRGAELQFYYALEGEELKKIGGVLDASVVSDECGGHAVHGSFTGAFAGMACSDLNGTALTATFDYFIYRPAHNKTDRYEV
jgi:xylan 1,4-beta-xylosidase